MNFEILLGLMKAFIFFLPFFAITVLSTDLMAQRAYDSRALTEDELHDRKLSERFDEFKAKIRGVSPEIRDLQILECLKYCPFQFKNQRSEESAAIIESLTGLLRASSIDQAEEIILSRYSEFVWRGEFSAMISDGLFSNLESKTFTFSRDGIDIGDLNREFSDIDPIEYRSGHKFHRQNVVGYRINLRSLRAALFIGQMARREWAQTCDLERLRGSISWFVWSQTASPTYRLRSRFLQKLNFMMKGSQDEVSYSELFASSEPSKRSRELQDHSRERQYVFSLGNQISAKHLADYHTEELFLFGLRSKIVDLRSTEESIFAQAKACQSKDSIIVDPAIRDLFSEKLTKLDQLLPEAKKCTQESRSVYLGN